MEQRVGKLKGRELYSHVFISVCFALDVTEEQRYRDESCSARKLRECTLKKYVPTMPVT